MKKIGIIFAMEEELKAFLPKVMIIKEKEIYDLHFYESDKCIMVISGVGKVNAARTAQVLIDYYDISYTLNVGVAGGVSDKLKVGDIVIGERMVQHDFDITAFNHDKGYIPNTNVYIKADSYLLKILHDINMGYFGTIASGDIFVTDKGMKDKINHKFNALCVEMEGSSIAQVCFLSKVPFIVIRAISDIPNNDNVITYEEFLEDSSNKISEVLLQVIEKIGE